MDFMIVLGACIASLVLLDITLMLGRLDIKSPLAWALLRYTWKPLVSGLRMTGSLRRPLLALAGPLLLVEIFFFWFILFVCGFALIYWAQREGLHLPDHMPTFGLLDAIYYSGVTGVTLGFGDIVPRTTELRLLAVIQAGLGFSAFTGVVTFILSLTSSIIQRNDLALRIWDETAGARDGVVFVSRLLEDEGPSGLRTHCEDWVASLRTMRETAHQIPVAQLYYRPLQPIYDPEPMLWSILEGTVAARLALSRASGFRSVVENLESNLNGIFILIGKDYLGKAVQERLAHPRPGPADEAVVRGIRDRLAERLDARYREAPIEEVSLELVARGRLCLLELNRMLGWQQDHPEGPRPSP
jgi:hypothetical protein